MQGHLKASMCSIFSGSLHAQSGFLPVSRFRQDELDQGIMAMEGLLQESNARSDASIIAALSSKLTLCRPIISQQNIGARALCSVPKLDSYARLSVFQQHWSQGIPVVVTNVQTKLQGNWAPEYFIERYGEQKVTLVNCETNSMLPATVSDFFQNFNDVGERKQILKLKAGPFSDCTFNHALILCRIGHRRATFVIIFLNYSTPSWMLFHLGMSRVSTVSSTWRPTSPPMEWPQTSVRFNPVMGYF